LNLGNWVLRRNLWAVTKIGGKRKKVEEMKLSSFSIFILAVWLVQLIDGRSIPGKSRLVSSPLKKKLHESQDWPKIGNPANIIADLTVRKVEVVTQDASLISQTTQNEFGRLFLLFFAWYAFNAGCK
jgi:hypothetical protein